MRISWNANSRHSSSCVPTSFCVPSRPAIFFETSRSLIFHFSEHPPHTPPRSVGSIQPINSSPSPTVVKHTWHVHDEGGVRKPGDTPSVSPAV